MIVDRDLWFRERDRFYSRMIEDLYIGYLDHGILDLLKMIFRLEGVFPKSSCTGRITIVDSQYPWRRRGSSIVYKSHYGLSGSDLLYIIGKKPLYRYWITVSGPIMHLSCVNLKTAHKMLRLARDAGFKHSGIFSLGRKGITVELISGVSMISILRDGEEIYIDLDRIDEYVSRVNDVLRQGRSKLYELKNAILKHIRGESNG